MKKAIDIILIITYALFLIFLLASSYLPNAILAVALLVALVTYNIGIFNPVKKKVALVFLVSLSLSIVYLAIPKKITSCSAFPEADGGPLCSSIECIGIPAHGIGTALCYGKS